MSDDLHSFEGDAEIIAAEQAIGLRDRGPGTLDTAVVRRWGERLSPLFLHVADVTPPDYVWEAISRRLDLIARRNGSSSNHARHSIRSRAIAVSSLAAMVVIIFVLIAIDPFMGRGQSLVATLGPGSASPVFGALYDPGRGTLIINPASGQSVGRSTPQLWFVPSRGPPVSLGILDLSREQELRLPPRMSARSLDRGSLAVSLEPPGGSPSGTPTGPIVANGALRPLDPRIFNPEARR